MTNATNRGTISNQAARYKRVSEKGVTFVFKYDAEHPDLLHIFVRHLASIDDALDVYFSATSNWNEKNNRFEAFSKTHGLFWFWLDEEKKIVMVISCFTVA